MRLIILSSAVLPIVIACAPIVDGPSGDSEPASWTGIAALTGFHNPEDLVAVPGSDWLIVSELRGRGQRAPGRLTFLSTSGGTPQPALVRTSERPGWGQMKQCATAFDPQGFGPHGIDIVKRGSQTLLLVVNHQRYCKEAHGACDHKDRDRIQERVELFEVGPAVDPGVAPTLTWRGCVRLPDSTEGNDVAALPAATPDAAGTIEPTGLAFAVSNTADSSGGLRTLFGLPTGEVLTWNIRRWTCNTAAAQDPSWENWCAVEGTQVSFPNGVAIDPSGTWLYLTAYGNKQILRIPAAGHPIREPLAATVAFYPDNLTWSQNGGCLLATGATSGPLRVLPCLLWDPKNEYCRAPFKVVTVDPDSLKVSAVYSHDAKDTFGFPSVALETNGHIYLGSAAGDRLARLTGGQDSACAGQ